MSMCPWWRELEFFFKTLGMQHCHYIGLHRCRFETAIWQIPGNFGWAEAAGRHPDLTQDLLNLFGAGKVTGAKLHSSLSVIGSLKESSSSQLHLPRAVMCMVNCSPVLLGVHPVRQLNISAQCGHVWWSDWTSSRKLPNSILLCNPKFVSSANVFSDMRY
jgi:hypothetical protein